MFEEIFLIIVFVLLSIANIISVKKTNKLGIQLTKPFLMPMLLIIYLYSTSNLKWLIIFALIFAFLGDFFLMGKESFFTLGLLFFLIGHIFYIIALLQPVSFLKLPFVIYLFLVPYTLYGIFIYRRLLPYLKSMEVYAFLYLAGILIMSFSSLLRIYSTNIYQFCFPFLGSILFVSSDTMLAFNEFKNKSKRKEVYIMVTYIMAQFLIVLGFIA